MANPFKLIEMLENSEALPVKPGLWILGSKGLILLGVIINLGLREFGKDLIGLLPLTRGWIFSQKSSFLVLLDLPLITTLFFLIPLRPQ